MSSNPFMISVAKNVRTWIRAIFDNNWRCCILELAVKHFNKKGSSGFFDLIVNCVTSCHDSIVRLITHCCRRETKSESLIRNYCCSVLLPRNFASHRLRPNNKKLSPRK